MGSFFSKFGLESASTAELRVRNQEINAQIKEDEKRKKQATILKILLLGTSESGKSTVLKQFRLIYVAKFSDNERQAMRHTVHSNILSAISSLIRMHHHWRMEYALPGAEEAAELLKKCSASTRIGLERINQQEADAIRTLWMDPTIKNVAERGNEFNLIDCAKYFLDSLDRLVADKYLPTDQDILYTRVITTGVTESEFVDGGVMYRVYDVGGHRSARKKWAPYFDDTNAILFVVAISSYDQYLAEDSSVNRILEALALFEGIVNHPLFAETSVILFLNKIDLFKEKIKKSKIENYFPEYKPPDEFWGEEASRQHATKFFRDKFSERNKKYERAIYIHETCSTDTKQIKAVISAVNAIIINCNLTMAGL